MKKLLVIAVALAAVNAQATRARVSALANSPHLVDTATVYNNPADVFALGSDYVNLESGAAGTTAYGTSTGGAEGMVVRTMGDTKWGLSLGHDSPNASAVGLRGLATSNAGFAVNQQNPIELTYGAKTGDMGWAATLVYSNFQDKTPALAAGAVAKESSMGVRLGARAGNWDAAVRLGLTSTVELGDASKYTGTAAIGANGGYMMDQWYLFGNLSTLGFKTENGAGTETMKYSAMTIALGAMTEVKKDGSGFFYGASLNQSSSKQDVAPEVKTSSLTLPVWIGAEVDAASWLTLRGSITQTLQLLNNTKTETAGATTSEFAPAANDTAVNLGAGLKFNKITVDGTLTAATTQVYTSTSLLAMLGLTYWY